jgi:hypothetical protein
VGIETTTTTTIISREEVATAASFHAAMTQRRNKMNHYIFLEEWQSGVVEEYQKGPNHDKPIYQQKLFYHQECFSRTHDFDSDDDQGNILPAALLDVAFFSEADCGILCT